MPVGPGCLSNGVRFAIAVSAAWAVTSLPAAALSWAQRPAEASSWVWRDQASGRLLYRTTAVGDRIPDFSGTGYAGGDQPLPNVDALIPATRRITVNPPSQGDAGGAIQAALDAVAGWPLDANGMRGLVQLAPGTFEISDNIKIEASGIVLRGTPDTRLRGTGTTQRSLILVGRVDDGKLPTTSRTSGRKADWHEVPNSRSEVIDDYVPVGAASLAVREPRRFQAGAEVIVFRPATKEWISSIGMDRMPKGEPWRPGERFDQQYERRVLRVERDRLFLDAPLPNSLDRRFGPAYVYRYVSPERIERIGLVELHGESKYDPSVRDRTGREVDEDHAWSFIDVDRTRNAWIERVTGKHFSYSVVILRRNATQVTVHHGASYAPISRIAGSRRYAFANNGQRNLMQDLYSESGRHDFANNAPSRGPNVFLRGKVVDGYGEVGPHQRWSTGTLFDQIEVSGARATLASRNRGTLGTGHGHAGANMVFWNSRAPRFLVESPPTAQNWVIGGQGEAVDPGDFLDTPIAFYDRHGATAYLDTQNREHSLFVAQQAERARLAGRNGMRHSYPQGDYAAARGSGSGAGQFTFALERDPGRVATEAVIRFAARQARAGTPILTIGGEPLRGDGLTTDRDRDVVTGTAVLSETARRRLVSLASLTVSIDAAFRLLWVELEVDMVPVTTSVPAPVKPEGRRVPEAVR